MQYFCAYIVLSGSMEPEIPTGSVVVVDGRRRNGIRGMVSYRTGSRKVVVVTTPDRTERGEEGVLYVRGIGPYGRRKE